MNEHLEKNCDRELDLLSYLYGELDESQSSSFEKHLRQCGECESELASFGPIHRAIATWKLQSVVGTLPATAVVSVSTRRKSALAAFKEFFNLAPLWTRAAVTVAVLAFFVLLGLVGVNLKSATGSKETASLPAEKEYSQREVDEIVDAAVRKNKAVSNSENVVHEHTATTVAPRKFVYTTPKLKEEVGNRRPLTRSERDQLAADLRLTISKDDNNADLLGEGINNY